MRERERKRERLNEIVIRDFVSAMRDLPCLRLGLHKRNEPTLARKKVDGYLESTEARSVRDLRPRRRIGGSQHDMNVMGAGPLQQLHIESR